MSRFKWTEKTSGGANGWFARIWRADTAGTYTLEFGERDGAGKGSTIIDGTGIPKHGGAIAGRLVRRQVAEPAAIEQPARPPVKGTVITGQGKQTERTDPGQDMNVWLRNRGL